MEYTKAFLFDLNGTMIDDMHFHLEVWHEIINKDLGKEMNLEAVRGHMYGKNHELLVRVFGKDRFSLEEMDEISHKKEIRYQERFKPHLKLLPGLQEFLEAAHQNDIQMAIGSAAIPFNIDFVLDNLGIRHYFKAIVSADDVEESKPHPETYLKAAEILKVRPSDCIVFEDAPKGVEAALNADMRAVAITNMHNKEEFAQYSNVLFFADDYNSPEMKALVND